MRGFRAACVVAALALGACGDSVTGEDDGPAESEPIPPGEIRDNDADVGDSDEPVYDCREVNGEEVCDTFGESDEGPGTG